MAFRADEGSDEGSTRVGTSYPRRFPPIGSDGYGADEGYEGKKHHCACAQAHPHVHVSRGVQITLVSLVGAGSARHYRRKATRVSVPNPLPTLVGSGSTLVGVAA